MRISKEVKADIKKLNKAMQAAGWQLTNSVDENDDGEVNIVRGYTGTATIETDGSGCWGAEAGLQVEVNCITVVWNGSEDDELCMHVGVQHTCEEDDDFMLYTDGGIEEAVSKLVGFDVAFTEQGMQDEGYMSMESSGSSEE